MPRFALVRHDSPHGMHFDFFLEAGNVLRTWALPQLPERGLDMACEALPDHRLAYLDYEGPVSGDRGTVSCWDRGTYRIHRQDETQLVVELAGEKIVGRVALRNVATEMRSGETQRWRLMWSAEASA